MAVATASPGLTAAAHADSGTKARVAVPAESGPYAATINATAARHGIPPHLVEAVIRAESNFDARAISPKGALGLMQLMPTTAAMLGVRNPFDAKQNIEGGVRHLVDLLYRYSGNLRLALAAYNAGEEAVRRHAGVPPYPETLGYVERIVAAYERGPRAPTRRATATSETATGGPAISVAVATVAPEPDRSIMYRYESQDGTVVFTNVPPRPTSLASSGSIPDGRSAAAW